MTVELTKLPRHEDKRPVATDLDFISKLANCFLASIDPSKHSTSILGSIIIFELT
ncbi:hypothetical protein YC2023_030725 [Brassica napus]